MFFVPNYIFVKEVGFWRVRRFLRDLLIALTNIALLAVATYCVLAAALLAVGTVFNLSLTTLLKLWVLSL